MREYDELPPAPERYVTTVELAEIMGVSETQIRKFKAEGMPYESWGLRAIRYQPSVAIAWAKKRGSGT